MIAAEAILRGKVLIVDDKEANVLLLTRMLQGAGYLDVTSSMRPAEVCELHLRRQFDLILLDLEMPGMDGFMVMENLKEIETGGYLPVLVITAQPQHKLRALRSGARDFITKPFEVNEVLVRVRNLLEVRLLHDETRRLYDQVAAEQEVAQRLLSNVLPESLAERLRARPVSTEPAPVEVVSEAYAEVAVLFADILAFTRFAEGVGAEVLIGVLDGASDRMGESPERRGPRELETLQDAYLAAVGLPDALADKTVQASHLALDLLRALDRFNAHSRYQLRVRIGLDTRDDTVGAGGTRSLGFDL